jgi:hypothetical protein
MGITLRCDLGRPICCEYLYKYALITAWGCWGLVGHIIIVNSHNNNNIYSQTFNGKVHHYCRVVELPHSVSVTKKLIHCVAVAVV